HTSQSLTTNQSQLYTLDPAVYSNGPYTLLLSSVNFLGLTNLTAYTINISNLPPEVTLNTAVTNNSLYGNNIILNGTVNGNGSAITALQLTVSNSQGIVTNTDISTRIDGFNWDFIINSLSDKKWTNGSYTVSLYTENSAGFTDTAGPLTFYINNLNFAPLVGPNPLDLSRYDSLTIKGLHWESEIFIYNINGRLIWKNRDMQQAFARNTDHAAGTVTWNMKNTDQQQVSSGIYLIYILPRPDAEPGLHKITVTR
ncbi:MAG TPA: hypothetical protein VKS21_02370, partial [Spirochaetota bacterium]|nr:hypothetical protein [Spirochaetota bacterium]